MTTAIMFFKGHRFLVTHHGLRRAGSRGIGKEEAPPRDEVERARQYLSENFEPAQAARRYSYMLKHKAECAVPPYVSNGALIEAAIELGFRVEPRDKINAWVYLKVRPDAVVEKPRRRGRSRLNGGAW